MPLTPRHDQLSRDELLLFQQKALRDWRESDWLATHDPVAWTALAEKDPSRVCVQLGGAIGESTQEPGSIVVAPWAPSDVMAQSQPERDAMDRKRPDVMWDFADGLPFEDQSVDDVYIRGLLPGLPVFVVDKLPRELARVLVVGGSVEIRDAGRLELERYGFAAENGKYILTHQKRPLEEMQPHLEAVLPDYRIPYRR